MFEREINVYAQMLAYCKRLVAELSEEQLAIVPAPSANPPLWILGHLAVATDWCLAMLGQPRLCPESWHQCFGRGSNPAEIPPPYPTKAELLQAIERGHQHVTSAARSADPEAMAKPHGVPLFERGQLKTTGDLVALLMTAHVGVHLGELTYWRRLREYPPLF